MTSFTDWYIFKTYTYIEDFVIASSTKTHKVLHHYTTTTKQTQKTEEGIFTLIGVRS